MNSYVLEERNGTWVILNVSTGLILASIDDKEKAEQTCKSMNTLMNGWDQK